MKRILWIVLLLIFLVGVPGGSGNAAERRSFYSGVRCLGMGGACIAVANDETALLVNPAALGKLRESYGTILDPELELGYQVGGIYSSSTFSEFFTLSDVLPSLDSNRAKYYHAKAQVFPSFVGKNFGVGLFGSYLLDAQMSGDGATVNTYYRSDIAFVLGFNFRFFDGRVKLGVNAKLINRIEVDNAALSVTGPLDYATIGSEGTGLSSDVGLIMTAPWKLLPTLSAVLRDAGNTSFTQSSGMRLSTATRPALVKQDLDVAVALFPIISNRSRSSWTVEYRGLLTGKDEPDKNKLWHYGVEWNFADIFFFRLGSNSGYWTSGFELASERFQWQFATYGEEIGTVSARNEDRRYNFKMSYRF